MIATPSFGGPDATVLSMFKKLPHDRYKQYLIFLRCSKTINHLLVGKSRALGISSVLISTWGKCNLLALLKIIIFVKKNRIQVVHSHNYKTDILTYLASKCCSIKLATTLHGWVEKTRRLKFYKRVDFKLLKQFNLIKTVSIPLRLEAISEGLPSDKVMVIPNAIDISLMVKMEDKVAELRDEFGLKKSNTVISYVGRLDREKNPGLLMEALPALMNKIPGLKCFFIGEGELKESLIHRAGELSVSRAVIFTGYRGDALSLISLTDILIITSWTEGIPKCLLEGMAFKKPVVATAVGGVPDVIIDGENGMLIPPGNREELINKVELLLESPDFRRRLGENGRALIESEYSDRRMVAQMDDFYQKLMEEADE